MVRPKKHLGQHFLTDHHIADKIADCLSPAFLEICEVGPGTGILTQSLLKRPALQKVTLIEIDTESVAYLHNHFNDSRMVILEADFLQCNLPNLFPQPVALIGNFPYNISSQIFFRLLENRDLFPETVGMIQKEVADRIASPPGNKTYGILSVLLQAWFTVQICFTVNETVFYPPPKVKSAVIRLVRNDVKTLNCNEKLFFKVVKAGFSQRRKTLRNSLNSLVNPLLQHALLNKRAEQLSVDEFVALTNLVSESQSVIQ